MIFNSLCRCDAQLCNVMFLTTTSSVTTFYVEKVHDIESFFAITDPSGVGVRITTSADFCRPGYVRHHRLDLPRIPDCAPITFNLAAAGFVDKYSS